MLVTTSTRRRRPRRDGAASSAPTVVGADADIEEACIGAPEEADGATMVGVCQSATVGTVSTAESAESARSDSEDSSCHMYGTAEGVEAGGACIRGAAGSPTSPGTIVVRHCAISRAPGRVVGCLASIRSIMAHRSSGTPRGRPGARRACCPRIWVGAPTNGGTPQSASYRTIPRE